jgi:hypothetical protein
MRGDELSRSRSLLLARWRGAPSPVRETLQAPAPAPAPAPARASAAELFRLFEAEALQAVGPAMADTLRRLLDGPRAAVSCEPDPQSYVTALAALDLVEDVLDAVVLTRSEPRRDRNDSDKELQRP